MVLKSVLPEIKTRKIVFDSHSGDAPNVGDFMIHLDPFDKIKNVFQVNSVCWNRSKKHLSRYNLEVAKFPELVPHVEIVNNYAYVLVNGEKFGAWGLKFYIKNKK